MSDLTLKGSFFIPCEKDTVFLVEIDIYGKERYYLDGELIEEHNGVGAGKHRFREFMVCNKGLRVEFNFKEGEYKSIATFDGDVIKDPVFEGMNEINELGVSSWRWRFIKYSVVFLFSFTVYVLVIS